MTPIKRRIGYIFRSDGTLRMRLTWCSGHRVLVLSPGWKVDRTDEKGRAAWDGARCRVRTFHGPDRIPAEIINRTLDELERKVCSVFSHFEQQDTVPTPAMLRKMITDSRDGGVDVWTAFDRFIDEGERRNGWAPNTTKSVRQVRNLFRKFRPDVEFHDINATLFDDFVIYQHTHKLSDKKYKRAEVGYSNAVIKKNCRVLKWFLRWCYDNRLTSTDLTHEKPAVKSIPRPVVFLTWDELMHVESMPIENPLHARARDFFCFCCFTSLRYSDAHALRHSHVSGAAIHVVAQKTATPLTIELNTHSRAILEKYRDADSVYALPRLSVNTLNRCIKEIGRAAGIDTPITFAQYFGARRVDKTFAKWELLSSHCARRTFICNALALGITPAVVMKWTGHSEFSAMRPYIDIADNIRRTNMALFDAPAPFPPDRE